ncbi:conserved Plasmodium protein, unknown function [Plasmodium knowlesi strain H]|uniref:Uncharacterized protein n=3 Tax=Plasmodium knowlesi TaxID=5850 RepID=A0A5K1UWL5_PLAKH|nr:conserved Plasmodium protein, unknown function [Plasmodium knowlesi strain H]OTN65704.1 Uncharacterized protein PKNOH_S110078500 [Plasmodium knowlesi]CAA9989406.1 conserved Plasmodium protein, unknown function [Plasmodium knowlesi strain H]SBO25010.1 conserved Plasmodium protein, unknown function [Plasmodium knowlesi strain H]SBO27866.1 conserved Plasmodium protein, unknown function [Plasmodium knowlesi strain H]VVS78880.1 conserved Plasmodium protein, unknown function [Plasmodium knowlesi |eukprot:XP_002260133.1 hypothetical protein, conserved in Plasmodium species [Plasmodium knowlesi strain H]
MAINCSFHSLGTDDMALQKYKTLIVHISFLLSIITMCVSLALVIVASILSRDEGSTYVDLNINEGDGTVPNTYVYIQNDSSPFALQLKGKENSVSVDTSMGMSAGEEGEEAAVNEERNGNNSSDQTMKDGEEGEDAVNEERNGNNSSNQTMKDGEELFVFDGDPQALPKGNSKVDELNPGEKQNKVIRIVMN